jgi:DNA primase large subunit
MLIEMQVHLWQHKRVPSNWEKTMASLFDRYPKLNKPQVKNYLAAEETATRKAALDLQEKGLSSPDAWVIARHVMPVIVQEKINAVHPTAANVDLPKPQVIESLVFAFECKIEEMDQAGELDEILNAHALSEQKEKYDF